MELQVELLEKSFAAVLGQGDAFGRAFYERLFEEFPETRDMFTQDNSMNLLKSLMYIVGRVKAGQMQELTLYLKQMGQRHHDYRVQPTDYPKVGSVLLATLRDFAGDVWDKEVERAWVEAFEMVQSVMQAGARQAEAMAQP